MRSNLSKQDEDEILFYNEIEQIWIAYDRVINKKLEWYMDASKSKRAKISQQQYEVLQMLLRIMPKSLRQYSYHINLEKMEDVEAKEESEPHDLKRSEEERKKMSTLV